MSQKPELHTLRGEAASDIAEMSALFERVTGRKPTPMEMTEARELMAAESEIGELPQAHFGAARETPKDWREDDAGPADDEDDDEPTAPDVVDMLGFDPDHEE